MNLASLHKLPVVFVCENNGYGISVCQAKCTLINDVASRAVAYDMPGVVVDGNNVVEVYEAAAKAVKRARAGEGPTLIECKTLPMARPTMRETQIRAPATAQKKKSIHGRKNVRSNNLKRNC